MRIKVGDIITIKDIVCTESNVGSDKSIRPCRFKVIKLYKNYARCENVKTGLKECFLYWDIKRNMKRKNRG